jgi:PadR family transcriptional regulator, regulatory protein PadR
MSRLLTDFELMIMLAILRLGNRAYGVPISRELEQTAGRPTKLGAVYLALDRLESQGLVTSELGEATAQRGGRAKKYFHVSAKGLRAVRATQRAFVALWTGIPGLQGGSSRG